MISIVVAALVAATPISLEEVRAASRLATPAQLSELDRMRAEEQVRVARSGLLPQVGATLGGGVGYYGPRREIVSVPGAGGTFVQEEQTTSESWRQSLQLTVGIRQVLFDATRWANLSAAAAQFDAAAEQAHEDRLTAELEGLRRFYELVRAQRSLNVLISRVKASEELSERAEALFQAGRRRKEDAISARINLGNDRSALVRQKSVVASASASLATFIGRPPAEPLQAMESETTAAPAPVVPAYAEALEKARATRPQLKALAALSKAAQDAVAGARGAYLPTADLAINYDHSSPQFGPFFEPARQNTVIGSVGIRWDIFNGFITNAQVGQAKVAERRALLQLEQANRDVEADLTSRIEALRIQLDVVKIAEDNLQLSDDNLKLAETRFQEGAGSTLEIRDAQNKRDQSALDVITSKIDLELARAGLERAIGAFGPGAAQ